MSVESNVFEKIRKVLIADATLNRYVNKRVYASHPSTIAQPKFPAISLFLLESAENESIHSAIDMRIQIDIWASNKDYNVKDMFDIKQRIRDLLHKQDLTDSAVDVVFHNITEQQGSPLMHEYDTNLYHLGVRFKVRAV